MTIVLLPLIIWKIARAFVQSYRIIDNGEIIAQGTLDELRTSGSMKEIRCDLFIQSYR